MRAGVFVVATRSGGPEEILRDGETGLLVPPGDPDALANAIRRVLDDPRLAARLASAAGDDAAGRFSLDAMLDGYERLYAEVLGAT
jgi:glycosyltransferase involved in cell wall biosynthesis